MRPQEKGDRIRQNIILQYLTYDIIITVIYYLGGYLILSVAMLMLPVFILLKYMVYIFLKLKYKTLFGGFLDAIDTIWTVEDASRTIINALFIINVNKHHTSGDVFGHIKSVIYDKIFKQPHNFPKLTSVRRRWMGYCYFVNNQTSIDDSVSVLEIKSDNRVLSEFTLQEIISRYSNNPLPKQNSALWEVLISPIPIEWKGSKEQNLFPVLFRFSHCLGDGLSLTNFLLRTFNNDNRDYVPTNTTLLQRLGNTFTSIPKNVATEDTLLNSESFIRRSLKIMKIVLVSPAIVMRQILRKNDVNTLHGKQLSGDKILVYAVERERQLVPLVKKIKRGVPGCKFSDVVFTALSATLENYFANNSQFTPNSLHVGIPTLVSLPNLDEQPMLVNEISFGWLHLPILMETKSLKQRLYEVMVQANELRNSPEAYVNYEFLKLFCGNVPLPLVQHVLNNDNITLAFSSVPGVQKIFALFDYELEDVFAFAPNRGTTGVTYAAYTYDNRFQIALQVDKALVSSVDEAQALVDDMFRYIILMGKELNISNDNTN